MVEEYDAEDCPTTDHTLGEIPIDATAAWDTRAEFEKILVTAICRTDQPNEFCGQRKLFAVGYSPFAE